MKKLVMFGLMMLMAGSAWAALPKAKVNCSVNGVQKRVTSAAACTAMGGTVVPAEPAKKL